MTGVTFNPLSFSQSPEGFSVRLEMYGAQDVRMKLRDFIPVTVSSDKDGLTVNDYHWDPVTEVLTVRVTGKNMQGEIGTIRVITSRGRHAHFLSTNEPIMFFIQHTKG